MATPPKQSEDQTGAADQASTPHLDRLERLAKAAETSAQDRQWRARKNGLGSRDEPSEVRNLTHDEEARAQAEAAMQKMMAKPSTKKPSRW
jgi:hypothetical protein